MTPDHAAHAARRRERTAAHLRGLYGMVDLPATSPGGTADLGARALALGAALLDGGVRILQLRMKGADARTLLEVGAPLGALCRARSALFCVNDRLDVALALDADVCHLGQDDLPLGAARPLAPPAMLLGISTHDEAQARAAWEGGADYLGFGPVFATRTKDNPDPVVGTARLGAVVAACPVPVVAIGGIDLATLPEVARAGARTAALIAAVNHAPDITAAARRAGELLSA